jgi:2-methylcitrate dehydratase PrpD
MTATDTETPGAEGGPGGLSPDGPTPADLRALADWAAGFSLADLPGSLLPTIRGCLLYGLAVGVATLRVPAAHMICATVDLDDPERPGGPALRLLDGKPATAGNAALANGVLLSGRVQGDSHPCGHIGGVAIPAALAVAQHQGLSGADLLAALIVGYETGLRIGRDHSDDLSARGFRTTPSYGVFTAAAAGARGLGLDGAGTRNALSVAANLAAGLREYVNAGTDESPFQAGFAARSGITSALLASTGLRAAGTALHGGAGFYSAYGGPESDHGSRLVADLGRQFEFTEVTYKPYPACQFLRGMIRGIADLRDRADGATPTEIEVRLTPFEAEFIGVRYAGPFSASSQTVMSAPFCAALAWTTGTVGYDGLRDFASERVLGLVPRVRIVADPALHRYQTHLRVELDDGRTLRSERADSSDAYRVTWEAAVPAARALCHEVGAPSELTDALIDAVAAVDRAPDVSAVTSAVRDLIVASSANPS